MLDQNWLRTFAPFGVVPQSSQWQPTGACVFIGLGKMIWCVTAGHVVRGAGALHVGCIVSIGGNQTVVLLSDIYRERPGLRWIYNDQSDLAAGPMPMPAGIEIRSIGFENFLDQKDLLPSMTCFTAGQPYGIPGVSPDKATPLILDGIIAGVDLPNKRLFISVPTFPGNSGGPIIVYRNPVNAAGGMTVGRPTLFLAGIVTETVMVPNNQPDKKHIPALHLGAGATVDAIRELLTSLEAQEVTKAIEASANPSK